MDNTFAISTQFVEVSIQEVVLFVYKFDKKIF